MRRQVVVLTAAIFAVSTVVVGLVAVSALRPAAHATDPAIRAGAPTRPAAKSSCPEAWMRSLPAALHPSDRALVPLSRTLLSVQASWSDRTGAQRLTIVSGGYLDDLTEPYDNLRPDESTRVAGITATVLTTDFLHRRVWVAVWRQPGIRQPCDVRAVIAHGLRRSQFYAVLSGFG